MPIAPLPEAAGLSAIIGFLTMRPIARSFPVSQIKAQTKNPKHQGGWLRHWLDAKSQIVVSRGFSRADGVSPGIICQPRYWPPVRVGPLFQLDRGIVGKGRNDRGINVPANQRYRAEVAVIVGRRTGL